MKMRIHIRDDSRYALDRTIEIHLDEGEIEPELANYLFYIDKEELMVELYAPAKFIGDDPEYEDCEALIYNI